MLIQCKICHVDGKQFCHWISGKSNKTEVWCTRSMHDWRRQKYMSRGWSLGMTVFAAISWWLRFPRGNQTKKQGEANQKTTLPCFSGSPGHDVWFELKMHVGFWCPNGLHVVQKGDVQELVKKTSLQHRQSPAEDSWVDTSKSLGRWVHIGLLHSAVLPWNICGLPTFPRFSWLSVGSPHRIVPSTF